MPGLRKDSAVVWHAARGGLNARALRRFPRALANVGAPCPQVRAKSKFWYFIRQFKRIKRMNGEIMACNEVRRPLPWALARQWVASGATGFRRGQAGQRTQPVGCREELRAGEGKRLPGRVGAGRPTGPVLTTPCPARPCADLREEAAEGEELRHLDALQQPHRPDQHVQGVPGRDADGRRVADV